jgi:hypothetical protein
MRRKKNNCGIFISGKRFCNIYVTQEKLLIAKFELRNHLKTKIFVSSPDKNKLLDHSPPFFVGLSTVHRPWHEEFHCITMSSLISQKDDNRYFDNLWAQTRAKKRTMTRSELRIYFYWLRLSTSLRFAKWKPKLCRSMENTARFSVLDALIYFSIDSFTLPKHVFF